MTTITIHGYYHYTWLLPLHMATITIHGYYHYTWLLSLHMATIIIHGQAVPIPMIEDEQINDHAGTLSVQLL